MMKVSVGAESQRYEPEAWLVCHQMQNGYAVDVLKQWEIVSF